MKGSNTKSGACILAETMLNVPFLHCHLNTINSLINKMQVITGYKFEISKADDSDDVTTGNGPWKVKLKINDIEVLVLFTVNQNSFIDKIDVIEL